MHIVHPSNIIDYTLVHHITALLSDWLTDWRCVRPGPPLIPLLIHIPGSYFSTLSSLALALTHHQATASHQMLSLPWHQPTNEPANVHFDFSSSEHSIQCTLLGTFLPVPASTPEVCLPDPICPLKVYIKSIHEFNNIVWQTIYSLLDLIKEPSRGQSVTVCVCLWVLPPLPE